MFQPSPAPPLPWAALRRGITVGLLLAVAGGGAAALAQPAAGPVPTQPYGSVRQAQTTPPPGPAGQRPWAEGRRPDGRWQELQRQEAEAIARLSPRQRRDYFEARRSLERRRADQQISRLNGTERCLGQASGIDPVQGCLRQELRERMQQRRQLRSELSQLRQRFGLPPLPDKRPKAPSTGGWNRWTPGTAPQPTTGGPQSWQPRSQPYHPLAWY